MQVEVVFTQVRSDMFDMPVWLEVLLNLSGYAGFVALASRGTSCPRAAADDRIGSDER
ncbi:hypothetical protein JQ614_39430 [Bradyrhizobium diazoefficiens]|nr:hypothetical protein [Bradyrhizobium diazoefficiens]MBR0867647.1 hypothetical protein [Bradyrhizobium diazoefficiens]MBR0892187.1 hypothetical protein [Bradyrhizobium diazoefficiens]MBR0923886.1 hypothetical protein [Bradyrhizobium diazoefficiens]